MDHRQEERDSGSSSERKRVNRRREEREWFLVGKREDTEFKGKKTVFCTRVQRKELTLRGFWERYSSWDAILIERLR